MEMVHLILVHAFDDYQLWEALLGPLDLMALNYRVFSDHFDISLPTGSGPVGPLHYLSNKRAFLNGSPSHPPAPLRRMCNNYVQ